MKKFDLIKRKDDFDSLYISTLYSLIKTKGKDKLIIKLFELPEVIEGFNTEMYSNNNWSFHLAFDSNLHTNPKFRKLKNFNIDVLSEINDFKLEFKKITNESRKPKELELNREMKASFMSLSESIEALPGKFGKQVQIVQKFSVSTEPNPIVANHSLRPESRKEIEEAVRQKHWVSLNGGISTGKTQLAALLYNSWEGDKLWVSLRAGAEETDFYLIALYALIQKTNPQSILTFDISENINALLQNLEVNTLIILDDLPKLTGKTKSDEFIVLLAKLCVKRNLRILSTSNYEVPTTIIELIPSSSFRNLPVPFMTKNETEEVILSYSGNKDTANSLKTFVFNISSGHPTIVSAICRFLSSRNWQLNDLEFNTLFSGDYSNELTENTFEYIKKTIPEEKSRELLFRLNLIVGAFSEREINLVCEVEPLISEPFIKLQSMLGLWLQRTSSNLYELSPLIKRLRNKNLYTVTEKRIFVTLGEEILSKRKIDQLDANNAIVYFISAKEYNRAGFVFTLVLNEAQNNPEAYFDLGFNKFWNTTQLPLEMDLNLRLYIRFIQTKLYYDSDKDFNFLLGDLEAIVSEGQDRGIEVGFAALWLSTLYSKSNALKSSKFFVIGYKGIESLKEGNDTQVVGKNFIHEEMIWLAAFGLKEKAEFDAWIIAFNNLNDTQKENSKISDAMDLTCSMIFHNFIKLEENKDERLRNWQAVLSDFEYIESKAMELNLGLLAISSVRFRITVLSEKLKLIDDAKILADKYINNYSQRNLFEFLLKDSIGRQLFYNGKSDDAFRYISDAVTIPVKEIYIEKLESDLVMSQLLGNKDQKKAHEYSKRAYEYVLTSKFVSETQRVKVIGEYSISLFLNNDLVGAIIAIEKGFGILLDSYSTSHQHKTIVLRYGHALNYFRSLLTTSNPPDKDLNGEPYTTPQRGLLTANFNPTAVDEYYFDERPFMMCYLLMDCFQNIGDYILSRKWAIKCLNLNNTSNIFYEIIHQCLFYLIDDHKYDEAFYWSIEVVKKMNERKGSDYKKLSSFYAFKETNKERPVVNIDRYDEVLIENVVLYLVIKTLKDSLDNPVIKISEAERLILVLEKWKEVFKESDSISEVIELLRLYSQNSNLQAIRTRIHEYNGPLDRPIKLIGYLILSMDSITVEALKLHSALIERLDTLAPKVSHGGYIYLVIPFFEKFWFDRHEKDPTSFINIGFWAENSIPYYKKLKDNKLKGLFKILYHHSNLSPSEALSNWMDF